MNVADVANARILIVGDFALPRRIIVSLLAEFGFTDTAEAADGQAALLELEQGRFDLLIADGDLPDVPVIELVKAVRAVPRLRSLPVLLVATEETPRRQKSTLGPTLGSDLGQAPTLGAVDYLVKPFSAEALKDKLDRVLQGTRCAA